MLEFILLGIRAIQFLFAIIELGLTGHVASIGFTPSQDSFMVYASAWTLLVLIYIGLAPRFFSHVGHVYAIFALDALTMIFWFAGFIALGVFRHKLGVVAGEIYYAGCGELGDFCGTVEAAVVFGAFEWILFLITTVFSALEAFRTEHTKSTTASSVG